MIWLPGAPDCRSGAPRKTTPTGTFRLTPFLESRLREHGLWACYERERLPVMVEHGWIDRVGVRINVPGVARVSRELADHMREIETKIETLAGRKINPASPKQLTAWLYEDIGLPVLARTDGGQPATDETTLSQLLALHEAPDLVLRWRLYAKIKGTYIDGRETDWERPASRRRAIMAALDPDGYVRMNTLVCGTETLRFVTVKPFAIHTFPKNRPGLPSIRGLIIPDDGYDFAECDYKSQEVLLQAIYAGQEDRRARPGPGGRPALESRRGSGWPQAV